jgi:protein-ribulosamine 3-kinase
MTSAQVLQLIRDALREINDASGIQTMRSVPGGYINHAFQVSTNKAHYLFKYNTYTTVRLISTEVYGLELLRQTKTIRIAEVLAYADANEERPGWMLQEWIEPFQGDIEGSAERLGREIALLHKAGRHSLYGLDQNNYIGFSPQENQQSSDWVSFFRERRLLPQMMLAEQNGFLSVGRLDKLDRLLARLDDWLGGVERQPALLHGDLWAGNVLYDPQGQPVLIDPSSYYGDREADLAYSEWSSTAFSPKLYAAYEEVWPTAPDRAERRDLYNLYHAINHLNHFGERYLEEIDRMLARYIS